MACAAPNSGPSASGEWSDDEFPYSPIYSQNIFTAAAPSDSLVPGNASAGAQTSSARGNRLAMDGVGARVIRGSAWKWGKQVSDPIIIFCQLPPINPVF